MAEPVNHDYRLGKLLQVDRVNGGATVFAWGLRNPWRFSFDRVTGDLVIADVGQNSYEEVDFAPAPGIGAGANYGWKIYEGLHTYPAGNPVSSAPGFVFPVVEYPHAGGACSITGGYVVRDPALPELAGTYLYGDNCTGVISGVTLPNGTPRALGFNVPGVSSFGEDGCGRVYAASLNGPVYRFATSGACAATGAPGGPGGAASGAGDRRAPAFTLLRAAARQHALRKGYVTIRVRCDELCTIRASGRVLITRRRARAAAAPALRTRTARTTLVAGASDDPAPEALEGHASNDQARAQPAPAPGDRAHQRARHRPRRKRAHRRAPRPHRPLSATSERSISSHGRCDRAATMPSCAPRPRGDEAAFAALVARHRPRLVRYATSRCGRDGALAEDAVQDALVRAHRAIVGGKLPVDVEAWLYAIVRNRCHDYFRAARPTAPLPPELPGGAPSAFEVVERAERLAGALDAVEALPSAQRAALVGRELEGRSYEEIAVRQETSVSAVKSLLHRARVTLAQRRLAAGLRGALACPPAAAARRPGPRWPDRRADEQRGRDRHDRDRGHERAGRTARAGSSRRPDGGPVALSPRHGGAPAARERAGAQGQA